MTPEEMLRLIDESWRRWLLAIEGIPTDRIDEPGVCGHWSVKDLVPHMALWDLQAIEDIDRHLVGLPILQNDWQRMNDDAARAARPGVYRLQLVEMHDAHRRMLAAVRDLSGDVDPDLIDGDTWLHYDGHTEHVTAWRAQSGI